MVYYDHAMVGATLALALGAQRRHGWPVVVLAALAGMFPDWDATPKHLSPSTYQAGHRVWGHNLFAVTLAGLALGGLGYLTHRSTRARAGSAPLPDTSGPGPWLVLGVLILWSHPLFDLLYCGLDRDADWPVALLWPVVPGRFGVPWVPWRDWGATAILLGGLFVCLIQPYRRLAACLCLVVLGVYVGIRGMVLHAA
jgi:hypothetical protein